MLTNPARQLYLNMDIEKLKDDVSKPNTNTFGLLTRCKQTKEFSRLTVLSNWRLEIKKHFDVSKHCFFPKPKINSTLLSFTPKKNNQFIFVIFLFVN